MLTLLWLGECGGGAGGRWRPGLVLESAWSLARRGLPLMLAVAALLILTGGEDP